MITPLGKRGFALPSVILALVILAVLITGALYMAQQEFRIGWSTDQATLAFNLAERSVDEALTNWDQPTYGALERWTSYDTAGALPDGRWRATITKMTDLMYFVDVTGRVSRGGPLRAGAQHRIGVIAHITAAAVSPPAALTSRGDITVRGSAVVRGQDSDPGEWDDCEGEKMDKPGITTDPYSTITTLGGGTIEGVPSVLPDPTVSDDTFQDFGNVEWDELVAMADLRPPPGSLYIGPSLRGDNTCNTGDPFNWGDPETPGSPCESWFPVVFVNGDARIQAGGSGQGILLVAGDLSLRGDFAYYGIIIVQGKLETQGNGNRVYGGIMAGNATFSAEVLTGGSIIEYSSCAVQRAIVSSSLTRARRLPYRSWVDVSYLTY